MSVVPVNGTTTIFAGAIEVAQVTTTLSNPTVDLYAAAEVIAAPAFPAHVAFASIESVEMLAFVP